LVYYSNGLDLAHELGPNAELLRGYSYNNYHQVLTQTNAMYEVTTNGYDATTRLLTWVHYPNDLTTTNTYNSDNRLSLAVDRPIDRTNSFTYYTAGMVYSHTDERGLTLTNYWDYLQRQTGVLYPDGTTRSNVYTYLDITATKDQLGNWTYYGYNAIRQKFAETNANNVITRYGYCDCGALMYVTNAFGTAVQEVTSFGYDNQGNRTFVFYPDGTTVTNWYDSLRRPIATADGIGTRWFGYNNQGLLTSITKAAGVEKSVVFDIEDRAYTVTDANAVTATNTYDNLGRLLTRTYPDTGSEKFGYSARGLAAYTNQLILATYYTYDEASRKTAETNANNEVVKYTFNAASDLLTLKDGKSQVTTWNYDQYGRVTNKLDQASVEILRYKYDADSRLTNRWSKAKGDTKYTYDNIGNLTLVDYPAGTTDITLAYDALNRLTNMVDAAGTTKYTYYAGGLLNTEDGPWSSDTVTYTYNNRLRASLSLQQPTSTWTNGYTWDAAHRLSTETSPAGTFTYTYSGAGRLVQKLALPNTSYITNTYESVARLTGTYLDNSSNTILDKSEYIYNAGNQRTRHTRTDASYYTNTYDNIGQLKWADSTVASEDRGYLYDAA
jgi:YD repeat-containing protein